MYALAERLHMTAGDVMRRMSAHEYAHWLAYFELQQENPAERERASQWFEVE